MSSPHFLRSLILPVYLPAIFFVLVNTACIIVLPLYLLDQGAGIAVASMAATLRGVGVLLVDVPAGIIANRLGDKPVMLLGVGTALLATALLVLFDSVWVVLLAAMLIGSSGGLYLMGRMSYINDVCRVDQRARALAVIATMQRFGSLVSPLVFSLVAQNFSYGLVFQVMALLILCNLVLVIVFARDIDAPHRRAARIRDMYTMVWRLRRVFMTAGMAGLTLMALRAGRQILFPIAGYGIGLDAVEISTLYSASMLVDLLLSYPSGVLMDSHGRKTVAVPGMVVLSLSLLSVVMLPGMPGMALFTLLSGIGNGLTTGILLTLASDYAPDAQRNQFIGIWRMQQDIGLLSAPLAVGALAESAGLALAASLVAGAGFVGTALMVFTVKETLEKQQ